MTTLQRDDEGFVIDAAMLAEAFGLSEVAIRQGMADGTITSRCETGVGEDTGRWRLTFRHGGRAVRLVVDETGEIRTRSSFPAGNAD